MQAIQTKYLGPTNFRGARIKAKAYAGTKVYPYDHALSIEENHRVAALMFRNQKHLRWNGDMVTGQLPDHSYVHVLRGES